MVASETGASASGAVTGSVAASNAITSVMVLVTTGELVEQATSGRGGGSRVAGGVVASDATAAVIVTSQATAAVIVAGQAAAAVRAVGGRSMTSESATSHALDLASKFLHGNGSVSGGSMNSRGLNVSLVDGLGSMVVLYALSLSLDDWLDLFNNVLVDMLANDGSIDRGGVSLVGNPLLVMVVALCAVSLGVVL